MKKKYLLLMIICCLAELSYGQHARYIFSARVGHVKSYEGAQFSSSSCWESGREEYTSFVYIGIPFAEFDSGCMTCNNNGNCTYGEGTVILTDALLEFSDFTTWQRAWENDVAPRCERNSGDDCYDNQEVVYLIDFKNSSLPSNGTYTITEILGTSRHEWTLEYTWKYNGTGSAPYEVPDCSSNGIAAAISTGVIGSRKVSLVAGKTYEFETTSGPDTYLRLFAPNGYSLLASDDNSGSGTLSKFTYTASQTGIHFIEVSNAPRTPLSAEAILRIKHIDMEAPAITCPTNTSLNTTDGLCTGIATLTATATDNCSTPTVSGPFPAGPWPIGSTVLTWTATDALGNSASCTKTITVTDNEAPTITCPSDISLSGAQVYNYSISTSDNCAGETWQQTGGLASGASFPIGTTTNTFTVTDASGNTNTCSFTVTVYPASLLIECPADITVTNDPGACNAVVDYLTEELDQSQTNQNLGFGGTNQWQSFTAGIAGQFTKLQLMSNGAISGPFTLNVYIGEGTTGTLLFSSPYNFNGVNGLLDINLPITSAPFLVAGDTYTFQIQSSGVDFIGHGGNPYSGGRFFTNTNPINSVNWDLIFYTYITDDIMVTGNFSPITITQSSGFPSGASFPEGTTTNTFEVTDEFGNLSTCSFLVTVNVEDQMIACPADITVNTDPGSCGKAVHYITQQLDQSQTDINLGLSGADQWQSFTAGASGQLTKLQLLTSGSQFPSFTLKIYGGEGTSAAPLFTGNYNPGTVNGLFDINLPFATAPFLEAGEVYTFRIQGSGTGFVGKDGNSYSGGRYFTNIHPVASINWDLVFYTYISDGIIANNHCSGTTITQTSGLPSGSFFPVGTTTNTFVATNGLGETVSCSFTVTVNPEDLVLNCPGNIVVNNDSGTCGAVVNFGTESLDQSQPNSDVGLFSGFNQWQSFTAGNSGKLTRIRVRKGGVQNFSFTLRIFAGQGPSGPLFYSEVYSYTNAGNGWLNIDLPPTLAPYIIVGNVYTFQILGAPQNVTFSVSDPNIYNGGVYFNSLYPNSNYGLAFQTYLSNDVGTTDNCSTTTISQTSGLADGSFFPVGTTTNTFLAVNESGDMATCSFTVTVNEVNPIGNQTTWYADTDSDGFGDPNNSVQACAQPSGYVSDNTDCDDTNGSIHPSAQEICDGLDNDCDGLIDDNDPSVSGQAIWYADTDSDGFGDLNNTLQACAQPSGYVSDNTDCDDTNGNIHPSAQEICDGLDNDCDGLIDDNDPSASGQPVWYADTDSDGFGDPNDSRQSCVQPSGYVSDNTDCDDTNGSIHPSAQEICDGLDNDCDGLIDDNDPSVIGQAIWYADTDSDGFGDPNDSQQSCVQPSGYVSDNTDCDDTNGSIHPSAQEICDGLDNDCDSLIDDNDPSVSGQPTWYVDTDSDGFGDPNSPKQACVQPSGYVSDNLDCDDTNGNIHPSAQEICDGLDNDCDGLIDDNDPSISGQATWFADTDSDGFGDPNDSQQSCVQPSGYVSDNTDCDDTNGSIHPSAQEICDGLDNDCDGLIDDNDPSVSGQATWYADTDSDGFGDPNSTQQACVQPSGYVSDNTDCDDTNGSIHPSAQEICDGLDNDCDGLIDDNDPSVSGQATWYADTDSDGFGDPNDSQQACAQPSGYVSDNTDCDDTNGNIHPSAQEICDGIDNDCDGLVDDNDPTVSGQPIWYADTDSDGFGDPNDSQQSCVQPSGYVSDNTDCDDTNGSIHPSAQEICDGLDNDCDGLIDDNDPSVSGQPTWYADTDSDGFGDPNSTQQACIQPSGYVSDNTDCDDTNGSIHPSAQEICDGLDNDCDGLIDDNDPSVSGQATWYADTDSDGFGDPNDSQQACAQPSGYVSDNTDCDDTNGSIHPSAQEICDGLDNDCDGLIDDNDPSVSGQPIWYADTDSDGFGDPNDSQQSCAQPPGYLSDNTDCDDTNGNINPSAQEICDGIDNDCDGLIDGADDSLLDLIAPTAICQNLTVSLDGSGTATITADQVDNGSSDNCEIMGMNLDVNSFNCNAIGNQTIILTVTDGINSSTCSAAVLVEDEEAPQAVCFNPTVNFSGENELFFAIDQLWDETSSSDNCEALFFVNMSITSVTCDQLGSIIPVTVTIEDGSGNPSSCTANVSVEGLPCGWSIDPNSIGCLGAEADYDPSNAAFSLTSESCYNPNYYRPSDSHGFIQTELCGDGEISTHVVEVNGNGWAGITMRESNDPNAKMIQLMVDGIGLTRRELRQNTGGAAFVHTFQSQGKNWLRLTRVGNQFSAAHSSDGINWSIVFVTNIPMASCIQIGLITMNGAQTGAVTGTFEQVNVSGGNASLNAPQAVGVYQEIGVRPDFQIYPNPVDAEVTINLQAFISRDDVQVTVYNLQGEAVKTIQKEEQVNATERIDLSDLPSGTYFVTVRSGKDQLTKKLIKSGL